jgi:hypothetical protein
MVRTGTATRHVRLSLERHFAGDDVHAARSIISPASHAARLSRRLDRFLIAAGERDRLHRLGLCPTWILL